MASSLSSLTTNDTHTSSFKGKATRSWPQLPPDLIRHIASVYLLDEASVSYCPRTWSAREFWQNRLLYTTARDGLELERLMAVCPEWYHALERHLYWHYAIAILDPQDLLIHHAVMYVQPPPQPSRPRFVFAHFARHTPWHLWNARTSDFPWRITPYVHFRNLLSCSCMICRLNSPISSAGLAQGRRNIHALFLGTMSVCKDHGERADQFCGVCLRDTPVVSRSQQGFNLMQVFNIGCAQNEDQETFPGIAYTCKSCRYEHLWRKASTNVQHILALGGTAHAHSQSLPLTDDSLGPLDWETRQAIESFVELSDGTVSEVLAIAAEKRWLRKYTRLSSILEQAIAARRFESGHESIVVPSQPCTTMPSIDSLADGDSEIITGTRHEDKSPGIRLHATIPPEANHLPLQQLEQLSSHAPIVEISSSSTHLGKVHIRDLEFVEDGIESYEDEDAEDEEDEEDPDILQSTEDNGVRDLALGDWARTRILDGFWVSPADLWQIRNEGRRRRRLAMSRVSRVRSVHPVPWALEGEDTQSDAAGSEWENESCVSFNSDVEQELSSPRHPKKSTICASVPPTQTLCDQAYHAHHQQLRTTLLPAMRNIVRKIVMECQEAAGFRKAYVELRKRSRDPTNVAYPGCNLTEEGEGSDECFCLREDPVRIGSKLSIDDVVRVLREEEGIWFDGMDWITKKRSDRLQQLLQYRQQVPSHDEGGSVDDGSLSTTYIRDNASTASDPRSSVDSFSTSPVPSMVTLQTTPSPPPIPSDGGFRLKMVPISSTPGSTSQPPARQVERSSWEGPSGGIEHIPTDWLAELRDVRVCLPPPRIPITPILMPPKMLRPIPYVPTSTLGLPDYTMESLKGIWREASALLYCCDCTICLRTAERLRAQQTAPDEYTLREAQVELQIFQEQPFVEQHSYQPTTINLMELGVDVPIQAHVQGVEEGVNDDDDNGEEEYDDDEDPDPDDDDNVSLYSGEVQRRMDKVASMRRRKLEEADNESVVDEYHPDEYAGTSANASEGGEVEVEIEDEGQEGFDAESTLADAEEPDSKASPISVVPRTISPETLEAAELASNSHSSSASPILRKRTASAREESESDNDDDKEASHASPKRQRTSSREASSDELELSAGVQPRLTHRELPSRRAKIQSSMFRSSPSAAAQSRIGGVAIDHLSQVIPSAPRATFPSPISASKAATSSSAAPSIRRKRSLDEFDDDDDHDEASSDRSDSITTSSWSTSKRIKVSPLEGSNADERSTKALPLLSSSPPCSISLTMSPAKKKILKPIEGLAISPRKRTPRAMVSTNPGDKSSESTRLPTGRLKPIPALRFDRDGGCKDDD